MDGCFLKGSFVGHLLVAVGLDPNNRIFPIAWATVEDLGISAANASAYTFMSDRDKGLAAAFKGVETSYNIWRIARAARVELFSLRLEELKQQDLGAWEWIGLKSFVRLMHD
ncbi:hypothetical protein M569_06881 [Genlisea aurea]|uniref:MULE transposase domain-containing protein n=1 Tax=Genlisea aurea TaxID=192259 RepID=S8E6A0_9LAMI|nr:hypothetical protein M569_06881 [Genlisea aurea]